MNSQPNQGNTIQSIHSFDEMKLKTSLLRGIYTYGIAKPSVIQQQVISPISQGRHVIAQSQSGTGKTAAFAIGALQIIDTTTSSVQVIVIQPTAELVFQTAKVFRELGTFLKAKVQTSVGGTLFYKDIQSLKKYKPHIIIGTPGRICQLLEHKNTRRESIKLMILDEADELLSSTFVTCMRKIDSQVPEEAKVALFSSTMDLRNMELANYLENPVEILLQPADVQLDNISHSCVDVVEEKWKYSTLCDLMNEVFAMDQTLLFCKSKNTAVELAAQMEDTQCLHSGLSLEERMKTLESFKCGKVKRLVCTDILSRGIDVATVTTVIHYDLPASIETYIHRVGRCGRFGTEGLSLALVSQNDYGKLRFLEDNGFALSSFAVPSAKL